MFKAVITEETTELQGTTSEILTGLACYIDALKKNKIPEFLIKKAIEIGLKNKSEIKEEKKQIEEKPKELEQEINEILKKILFN